MEVTIRPARMEDRRAIAAFTRDTFSWGDYVAGAYKDWLADRDGFVLVGADEDDEAIAVGKVTMLSATEAWGSGARVHPDWRRRGIGSRISEELWEWARERGAQVLRLIVEDWNEPARAQVEALGLRPVSRWDMADRAVGDASPVPEGNGGRRTPAPERLRTVPSSEAEPSFLSWVSGPLSHAGRSLFPIGWSFRRMTVDDVAAAARDGALWESPAGWAVARNDGGAFRVEWVETNAEDSYRLARALVDAAVDAGAERLMVWVPEVEWLVRALRRIGCELHPMTVYAMGL